MRSSLSIGGVGAVRPPRAGAPRAAAARPRSVPRAAPSSTGNSDRHWRASCRPPARCRRSSCAARRTRIRGARDLGDARFDGFGGGGAAGMESELRGAASFATAAPRGQMEDTGSWPFRVRSQHGDFIDLRGLVSLRRRPADDPCGQQPNAHESWDQSRNRLGKALLPLRDRGKPEAVPSVPQGEKGIPAGLGARPVSGYLRLPAVDDRGYKSASAARQPAFALLP